METIKLEIERLNKLLAIGENMTSKPEIQDWKEAMIDQALDLVSVLREG